ncbi:hypothetical protein [Niabella hibiscisoli]|uniref:hypothetical protein n=1 Tax=Niabella hibiscisoli TaxID=1825928 RepID=UPI001F10B0DA|nr:hypothetical protein [Niabella hibiscisoli]MCH5717998.1 hypothetical protein [Niabella hibiscisoli]
MGVDVPGYGHIFTNNISYRPAGSGDASSPRHVTMLDTANSSLANNAIGTSTSFLKIEALASNTNHYDLILPRKADGSLPDMDFYRVRSGNSFFVNNTGTLFEGQALPVDFENLAAFVRNGRLRVRWITASESNSHHFEVEASTDGTGFYPVGQLLTLAPEGSSSALLQYHFENDWRSATALSGVGMIVLLLALDIRRKYCYLPMAGVILLVCFACNKNDGLAPPADLELYLRIKQVDLDGSFKYSKVVKAVVE